MLLNRRKFIKYSMYAVSTVVVPSTIGSVDKEPPTIYPSLKGKKIQPPQSGCYIGFYNEGSKPTMDDNEKRIKFKATFSKYPKTLVAPLDTQMMPDFPKKYAMMIDSLGGATPYIYSGMRSYIKSFGGFSDLCDNKDFSNTLTKYAQGIREFGKPIFFTTMRELNGDWFPWGKMPDTAIKTWRFMWKIFEDNGANEFTTWVWEPYCPIKTVDPPRFYYPGDEYVDWIGLSSYCRTNISETFGSFEALVGPTYHEMRQAHKEKPIMMAEFGHTNDSGQLSWLKNAFDTIKSWSGMKGAIFWNNINRHLPDDHTLSEESIKFYQQLANDPYFVWS